MQSNTVNAGRGAVGWVELIRAFTPVFAGYAKPINRRRWVSQELNPRADVRHSPFPILYNCVSTLAESDHGIKVTPYSLSHPGARNRSAKHLTRLRKSAYS
jgi:hypothetical protein